MALNPIHKVRVAVSQGPRDEQKQYSPRERDGEREKRKRKRSTMGETYRPFGIAVRMGRGSRMVSSKLKR